MIKRNAESTLIDLASQFKVLAVVGPRQSGKTITKNYFKGLEFWQKLTEEQEGAIVYAGDDMQRRSSGITVYPWNRIPEIGT